MRADTCPNLRGLCFLLVAMTPSSRQSTGSCESPCGGFPGAEEGLAILVPSRVHRRGWSARPGTWGLGTRELGPRGGPGNKGLWGWGLEVGGTWGTRGGVEVRKLGGRGVRRPAGVLTPVNGASGRGGGELSLRCVVLLEPRPASCCSPAQERRHGGQKWPSFCRQDR